MKMSVKNKVTNNVLEMNIDFESRSLEVISLPKDYMFDEIFTNLTFNKFECWLYNRAGHYRTMDNIIDNIRTMHGKSPVDHLEIYIDD